MERSWRPGAGAGPALKQVLGPALRLDPLAVSPDAGQ